jgi:hypothetical protein
MYLCVYFTDDICLVYKGYKIVNYETKTYYSFTEKDKEVF